MMCVLCHLITVFLLAQVESALVLTQAWGHLQRAESPLLPLTKVLHPHLHENKVSEDRRYQSG